MTTKADHPESVSVSHWLAELRMECYKKNLEHFDTVKPLLEFKDLELKKLGVTNSKDRSIMLGSLASYRAIIEDSSPVPPIQSLADSTKPVSRRSSLRNFNFKGLLSSSGSKKSKKSRDSMSVTTTPSLTSALDLHSTDSAISSPTPTKSYPIPDYEEVLRACKVGLSPSSSGGQKAIPNEYVHSPPDIEPFRGRVNTVGVCQSTPTEVPLRHLPESRLKRDSVTTCTTSEEDAYSTKSNLSKSHHLSVISMESGLSFGYDVEINPSLPLEVQPWFHGKLSREEAVALLRDEGDFLVRENTTMPNTYTLSMQWRGQIDHTLIQFDEVVNSRNGTTIKYSFDGGAFDSVPELIYHHLKYQIPISKDTQNMLMTPTHRPGAKLPFTPAGYYQPSQDRSERGHSTSTGRSSPCSVRSVSEDHGYHRSFLRRTSSPDAARQPLRPLRSNSMSPGAFSMSPRQSPGRELAKRSSNSSGELLETDEVDQVVLTRNPPSVVQTVAMRSRAMTDSRITPGSPNKRDSFGDYEVMESVSVLGSPPSQRKGQLSSHPVSVAPQTSNAHSHAPVKAWNNGGDVKYAEIQHFKRPHEITRRGSYAGHQRSTPPSSGVQYAEVRFQRKQQSQPNVSPHPFSVQTSPVRVNPYQSRAEILAQKLQPEPTTSTPSNHQHLNRTESSPHPFSRHSTHSLPRQASSPLTMAGITEEATSPLSQPEMQHSLTDSSRKRPPLQSSRSTLVTDTQSASKEGQGAAAKVPKSLPGHEMLVGLHNMLNRSTEKELAYHLTRADAVAFLLTPRPGEDKEVWKERVQRTTSSSGLYVGLQTLADSDGEKLWKKLYFRHLSLSQMVSLSIVSAGDAVDRAHTLRRFIELAFILQSGTYGNLFSFISIMQGLTSPQVLGLSQTWQVLHSTFPESTQTFKQLQDILTRLSQGVSMYATDQISIPAIQHLKTAFHFEEPSLPGHASSAEDHSLLGQHTNLLVGLDGIHTIIKHASRFSYNARKRLEPLPYNVKLMDFFAQDFTRSYLHSINVTADDHLERRRRFDVLLSALVERVEAA